MADASPVQAPKAASPVTSHTLTTGDSSSDSDSDSDSDEDIPFACLICRKPYTDPVQTRCGHYFCSACAIKRFAKTPKCAACGTATGGMFNRADKVIDKMKEKKKADSPKPDMTRPVTEALCKFEQIFSRFAT